MSFPKQMEDTHISINQIMPIIFGFMLFNSTISSGYFVWYLLCMNGILAINDKYRITEKFKNFIDDIELRGDHNNFLWELLHTYSKAVIVYKKYVGTPIKQYIFTPFYTLTEGTILDIDRIIFVSNGHPVLKFKSKKSMLSFLRTSKKRGDPVYEYDFILFYPKNQNIMILDDINDIPDINQVANKQVNSKVEFMACQLVIHNEDGDIKKHLSLDQYMINGNEILSKEFVLWYCKTYFGDEFVNVSNLNKYTIYLLDNNVNEITLTHNDAVKIYTNNYKIISYEDEDENDEVENDNTESNNEVENDNTESNNQLEIDNKNNNEADNNNSVENQTLGNCVDNENKLENNDITNEETNKEEQNVIETSTPDTNDTNLNTSGFWDVAKFNFKYFNGSTTN